MITQSSEAFSVKQRTRILCNKRLQYLEKRKNRNEINFNRTKYKLILGIDSRRGAVINQKKKEMRKKFVY